MIVKTENDGRTETLPFVSLPLNDFSSTRPSNLVTAFTMGAESEEASCSGLDSCVDMTTKDPR